MSNSKLNLLRFAFIALGFICATATADQPVVVDLHDMVSTEKQTVTLADVSQISGESSTRDRLAALDLVQLDGASDQKLVTKKQVITRILIAGFSRNEFTVSGADSITIKRGQSRDWATEIEQAIARQISASFDVDVQDVEVEIQNDLTPTVKQLLSETFEPSFRPLDHGDRLIGKRSVEIGVFSDDKMVQSIRITTNSYLYNSVAVSSRPIEKGAKITADDFFMERRRFQSKSIPSVTSEQILGQIAIRRIRAQQLILPTNFQSASVVQRSSKSSVVRPRDIVTVVANRNGLQVSMSGVEVLKAGNVGDIVMLRNPNTKKTIYGRVLTASRVELIR